MVSEIIKKAIKIKQYLRPVSVDMSAMDINDAIIDDPTGDLYHREGVDKTIALLREDIADRDDLIGQISSLCFSDYDDKEDFSREILDLILEYKRAGSNWGIFEE